MPRHRFRLHEELSAKGRPDPGSRRALAGDQLPGPHERGARGGQPKGSGDELQEHHRQGPKELPCGEP